MMERVLIAGASGLIGGELIKLLLVQPSVREILVLVRRRFPISHPKLKHVTVDFDSLETFDAEFHGECLFCCLGSTLKKTPDLLDYREVDHDYPCKLAELSQLSNINQFHLVSALGANSNSKQFYLKMKGETENAIKKIFSRSLHIYQPALLTGERNEPRRFEKTLTLLMKAINPFLVGSLEKYRSIKASTVAQTMVNQALKNMEGVYTYPSNIIEKLA
ncbi:MAG TPA: nucleoside-diphosphate sugar epimerase [Pedobacter sp.]|jgi:uncharacterized protein YbjT (DUF2867 family)